MKWKGGKKKLDSSKEEMEVFGFLVGTQITGQLCFQDGSLAASCSAAQKQQPSHSQAGDKWANQLCVVYTIPYFDSETTLSLPPKSASFFYYGRAELLILQKKSQCMMQIPSLRRGLHADEGLNLFPFNRSVTIVCPPGLPFL